MRRLMNARVTAQRFDEVAGLVVAVPLLVACTALTLLMGSELASATTFLLGAAVGGAAVLLALVGWHLRRG